MDGVSAGGLELKALIHIIHLILTPLSKVNIANRHFAEVRIEAQKIDNLLTCSYTERKW